MADDLPNAQTPTVEPLARQRLRKTALEMISLAVPNGAAVYFSGWLIAGWSAVAAGLWGLLAVIGCAGYWTWHRGRYPAQVHISKLQPERQPPRREMADDAGPIWHPVNLLVLGVGAVAVATVIVLGTLMSFLLPLIVVFVFALVAGGGALGGFGLAVLATLGVALVVELAVVLPLSRLWKIPLDDDGPSRADFCPPPD